MSVLRKPESRPTNAAARAVCGVRVLTCRPWSRVLLRVEGVGGVALHSLQENLDLSSASGRMFYNVLGTFAQFFREQLAENVRMGNERAVKEGKWINRPKTGYDLRDGDLVPNDDAPRVREVFRLRGRGKNYRDIEDATGIKYSTVRDILGSRIYRGEVLHNGVWSGGRH